MKKLSFILFVTTFSAVLLSSPVLASGDLTTNNDSKPGQAILKNENGVMFLTTQTNPDGENVEGSPSSKLKNSSKLGTVGLFNFELPTGYATDLGQYINAILRFLMLIVALLVFYYLIRGGFKWITSGGDKGKIGDARQMIFSAIIGLIVFASSWAILLLVINFLGFATLDEVFENIQSLDGQSKATRTASPSATTTNSPTPSPIASSSGILSL